MSGDPLTVVSLVKFTKGHLVVVVVVAMVMLLVAWLLLLLLVVGQLV